ncbi:CPBP family intramembrane metalloprotease [Kineosporia sp. J2-2]|uniref:CPBP family intramembrane metalloprotease n=1 Tax=Kineosporia corallincola TaxID=2835133 RepID=A0ABS5TBH8_9ACTN|nr:CPBP family intramembrane metalloprotease [Kineosporia corallincola]
MNSFRDNPEPLRGCTLRRTGPTTRDTPDGSNLTRRSRLRRTPFAWYPALDGLRAQRDSAFFLALLAGASVVNAVAEESLWRRAMPEFLRRQGLGWWPATAACSVSFGLAHRFAVALRAGPHPRRHPADRRVIGR